MKCLDAYNNLFVINYSIYNIYIKMERTQSISLPSYKIENNSKKLKQNTNSIQIVKCDINNKFEPEFISGTPPTHFIELLKKRIDVYSSIRA